MKKTEEEVFGDEEGVVVKIVSWKVREGSFIKKGIVLLDYAIVVEEEQKASDKRTVKYRASKSGVVVKMRAKAGDLISKGSPLLTLEECSHPTVITDLCAVCGIDFRKLEEMDKPSGASVSMIHTVPDLRCSMKEAQEISKTEENRLLKQKKLHLLVDLDQTLIHTTNMDVPPYVKDVIHFQLPGSPLFYHTRLRPGTRQFLQKISQYYELHICTFGSRSYAHVIARHLDPDGKYFYIRILSRDECFSQNSKTPNLSELFPSGDHMVCIIDDREDVWNFTPNLIHVKPYHFFSKTGDINAPPSLSKREQDNKEGFDFSGPTVKKLHSSVPTPPLAKIPSNPSSSSPKDKKIEKEEGEIVKSSEKNNEKDVEDDLLLTDENESESERAVESESSSETSGQENNNEKIIKGAEMPHVFDMEEKAEGEKSEKGAPKGENVQNLPSPDGEDKVKAQNELKNEEKSSEKVGKIVEECKEGVTKEDKVDGEVKVEEIKKDESKEECVVTDPDDYLLYLEDILLRVHKEYYEEYERNLEKGVGKLPSVKEIIPSIRKRVLKGCSIVFSGIVPVGVPITSSRPYSIATSLGATVTPDLSPPLPPPPQSAPTPSSSSSRLPPPIPTTTHVVAARLGTAKTNEGRRRGGVKVVSPEWLWACAERWEWVDERLFGVRRGEVGRRVPPEHVSPAESDDAFSEGTVSEVTRDGVKVENGSRRVRTLSGRFMDTINPLLSFSMDEIADMDHEVDDICGLSGSSSSSEDESQKEASRVLRKKKSKTSSPPPPQIPQVNERVFDKNSSSSDSSDSEGDEDEEGRCWSRKRRRRDGDCVRTETEPEEEESLFTKFRRGEPLPSDVEMLNLNSQSTDEEEGGGGGDEEENEWMARQLEAEFMKGDEEEEDDDEEVGEGESDSCSQDGIL